MTPQEAAWYIVMRWLLEHHPLDIMLALICLGVPCEGGWTKKKVLAVIRRYIDCNTENNTYRIRH